MDFLTKMIKRKLTRYYAQLQVLQKISFYCKLIAIVHTMKVVSPIIRPIILFDLSLTFYVNWIKLCPVFTSALMQWKHFSTSIPIFISGTELSAKTDKSSVTLKFSFRSSCYKCKTLIGFIKIEPDFFSKIVGLNAFIDVWVGSLEQVS